MTAPWNVHVHRVSRQKRGDVRWTTELVVDREPRLPVDLAMYEVDAPTKTEAIPLLVEHLFRETIGGSWMTVRRVWP